MRVKTSQKFDKKLYSNFLLKMTYQPTHEDLCVALSPEFLEKNPMGFLENLKLCIEQRIDITEYINDASSYATWYSPLPMCLVYLVGDLVKACDEDTSDFYGSDTIINEDVGIEIMKYLWLGGADFAIIDYYNTNISDYVARLGNNQFLLTRRTNNKKFLNFIRRILN